MTNYTDAYRPHVIREKNAPKLQDTLKIAQYSAHPNHGNHVGITILLERDRAFTDTEDLEWSRPRTA